MENPQAKFLWSDAWLFLAIGLAAKDGSASLASVLPFADGIQHAIPSMEELNGALGRLRSAGYVNYAEHRIALTQAGAELLRTATRAGPGLLAQQHALEAHLRSEPWTTTHDPHSAHLGEPEVISMEEWIQLTDRYRAS